MLDWNFIDVLWRISDLFCPKCGSLNQDDANNCVSCGASLQQSAGGESAQSPAPQNYSPQGPAAGANIPNHLVWAILSTICCCLPAGIVAIVFAAQVNSKIAAGDIAGAQSSSQNALLWTYISVGLGLFSGIVYFGLTFMGVLAELGSM